MINLQLAIKLAKFGSKLHKLIHPTHKLFIRYWQNSNTKERVAISLIGCKCGKCFYDESLWD